MKTCLNCHAFVDDDALICPHCGQDFSEYNQCPNCGKYYIGFSYMCSYCGHPLYDNKIHDETRQTGAEEVLPDNKEAASPDFPTLTDMPDEPSDAAMDTAEVPADTIEVLEEPIEEPEEPIEDLKEVTVEPEEVTVEPEEATVKPEEAIEESAEATTETEEEVAVTDESSQQQDEPIAEQEEPSELSEEPSETAKLSTEPASENMPAEERESLEDTSETQIETTGNQADSQETTATKEAQTEEEPVVIIEEDDENAVVVVDDADKADGDKGVGQTTAPAVPLPAQKKEYSRRHVADKIGKKEETKTKTKSKVLNLANETDEQDFDEEEEKKERRFSKWLHWFLFLFFLTIIAAGVGAFMYYDNLVSRKKEAQERAVQDSLFNLEKAKQQRIKAERAAEDSLLNQQISAQHESDSLDKVRQNEFRRLDSIRVDTFMTRVITDVCPSNKILARQLDGQNYIYYYTDLSSPIFKLCGFDGVKKETFTIIDDIQAQLVDSYVTPDHRNLIILCRDEKHEFGLAYKYNMYDSTLADYESMDKDGNKCYDVGTTEDGFYMKFGRQENKTFQSLYTSFFDKYGNFITQQ